MRRDKSLSQAFVADKIGLSKQSSYQRYESGLTLPPADKLKKLAELFDVTTDYLLGMEPEKPDMAALRDSAPMMLRMMCENDFRRALASAGDDVHKLKALWESIARHH